FFKRAASRVRHSVCMMGLFLAISQSSSTEGQEYNRNCRLDDPRPGRYETTMAKRFSAAIIGGSGYGGAELIRRLLHPREVGLVRVASVDYVGEPLSAAHPNLEGLTPLRFEELPPEEAARGMDVVLLGLPHKVSAHKVPAIIQTGA